MDNYEARCDNYIKHLLLSIESSESAIAENLRKNEVHKTSIALDHEAVAIASNELRQYRELNAVKVEGV